MAMPHHQISNREGCVTLETCASRRCHQDISGLYTGDNRPVDLLMTTKALLSAIRGVALEEVLGDSRGRGEAAVVLGKGEWVRQLQGGGGGEHSGLKFLFVVERTMRVSTNKITESELLSVAQERRSHAMPCWERGLPE
jgi:hypothetical protein